MENWCLVTAVCLVVGCSRRRLEEVRADPPPVPSSGANSAASASASASIDPDEPPAWPEGKRALEPFLSIAPATIPSDAFTTVTTTGFSYAPKGFDPAHAKPTRTWHMADGSDLLEFVHDGASDFESVVAVKRAGKIVSSFASVRDLAVDAAGSRFALAYTRKTSTGAYVLAHEIVDSATGAQSPVPRMPCTHSLRFDGGRLLGQGYVFDKPFVPHASICILDPGGKLLVAIDAGLHNHHAAAADYINMTSGVLEKDPGVVWATREYEPFGGYDLTLLDTSPPHGRKIARLETNEQLGDLLHLEIDLAATTMASTKVRFRTNDMSDVWSAWVEVPLVDAP